MNEEILKQIASCMETISQATRTIERLEEDGIIDTAMTLHAGGQEFSMHHMPGNYKSVLIKSVKDTNKELIEDQKNEIRKLVDEPYRTPDRPKQARPHVESQYNKR